MKLEFEQTLKEVTAADKVGSPRLVQSLWSGYGEILRVPLTGSRWPSVIVKAVQFPQPENHPRGWQSGFAHQRKLQSYQVELDWYRHYSEAMSVQCYCPQLIWQQHTEQQLLLVMEDLAHHYPLCPEQLNLADVKVVLSWLAHFHGNFINKEPQHLWPVGSYWHLATRPDEYQAMANEPLKKAASAIDAQLNNARFKTIIHGDAKLANFCFSADKTAVAAVDFQYVGGGCGMKDVAYFLTSCLTGEQCQQHETQLLKHYFSLLQTATAHKLSAEDFKQLEHEWRQLYAFAWADFERFLNGWSPEHWKITPYAQQQTQQALSVIAEKAND